MKKSIIILLAAGNSSRFRDNDQSIEKQFYKINNKSIFEICLRNINQLNLNLNILPVVKSDKLTEIKMLSEKYNTLSPIEGGKTRQESVFNALKYISTNKEVKFVLIHDAARPIMNKKIITSMFEQMKDGTSCVAPCLKISDAIRKINNQKKFRTLDKKQYILLQTPQLCLFKDIFTAHKKARKDYEDETSLLIDNGYKIKTIQGKQESLKITYYEDLEFLKPHLENSMKNYVTKVGIGYDVHKLIRKNKESIHKEFKLGGHKIDIDYYLQGHSDSDVLLHSFADSIYGALNFLDIGQHFPPTLKKWENSDSFIFLNHALKELEKREAKLIHTDIVIITELPKISLHSNNIKHSISKQTGINQNKISIKGKTNEGVGFIGRKEGLAVITNTTIMIKEDEI